MCRSLIVLLIVAVIVMSVTPKPVDDRQESVDNPTEYLEWIIPPKIVSQETLPDSHGLLYYVGYLGSLIKSYFWPSTSDSDHQFANIIIEDDDDENHSEPTMSLDSQSDRSVIDERHSEHSIRRQFLPPIDSSDDTGTPFYLTSSNVLRSFNQRRPYFD